MVLVWHMVPSAAGMLLVMQRLLLLRHHNSLQTSCKERDFGGEREREEERDKDTEPRLGFTRAEAARLGQQHTGAASPLSRAQGHFLYWVFTLEAEHKGPSAVPVLSIPLPGGCRSASAGSWGSWGMRARHRWLNVTYAISSFRSALLVRVRSPCVLVLFSQPNSAKRKTPLEDSWLLSG